MKVKLTRIESTHRNLRTDEVVGECRKLPTIGERFLMTAPPLELGDIRIVDTSPVRKFEGDERRCDFWTLNSHYRLEVLS